MMEEEDYWTKSDSRAFSFDEDELIAERESSKAIVHRIIADDNFSERSYELTSNEIPLSSLLSPQNLQKVLDEQSLAETQIPKSTGTEDELKALRRRLRETIHAPPVNVLLRRILMKKPYSLACVRSLAEKEELLDGAIHSGNGDAILTVVLFIKQTLKKEIFYKLLDARPTALNQYIHFLKERGENSDCADLLGLLGKQSNLAFLQFGICIQKMSSPTNRLDKLKVVYNDYFKQPGISQFFANLLASYIRLLAWQAHEASVNKMSNDLFDTSVLETIYFACSKHKWHSSDAATTQNCPYKLAESHKVTQSQFEWIALHERSRSQAWRDVELLFEKKVWHNLKAKAFTINVPLDKAVLLLYALEAPRPVLNTFLSHISDAQRRMALAKRVDASKSVIDSLIEMKEGSALEAFISTLETGTELRFYAEHALKSMKSLWKTDSAKAQL